MKQFTLPLDEHSQRPIVYLGKSTNIFAMLDTGALFPIWVEKEEILSIFGATLASRNVEFGGFGGKAKGNIYRLPNLIVGDLVFSNMSIIACELDLPCQMILSATMFKHLIYEIDDYNHAFNVTIPDKESNVRNLKIEDKDGKLHILCTSFNENQSCTNDSATTDESNRDSKSQKKIVISKSNQICDVKNSER